MNQFYEDVISGLTAERKYLYSKYFYDSEGDKIFQEIMKAPEYYLTNCEMEIFKTRCKELVAVLSQFPEGFELIELGAGDATKSKELLSCLMSEQINFTYYPTDISEHVVRLVEDTLPQRLPGIRIKGLVGEFFDTLEQAKSLSRRPKVVMFLGANIGNMPPAEAEDFLRELHAHLSTGEMTLIGFDLVKNPWQIFHAYNDKGGATRDFNLNLLKRINRELNADFQIDQFDHYESYDPETGACKSYLFSLCDQPVTIDGTKINFRESELIYMETSQKYTPAQIDRMARKTGFKPVIHLTDSKHWFADVIWQVE